MSKYAIKICKTNMQIYAKMCSRKYAQICQNMQQKTSIKFASISLYMQKYAVEIY